MVLQLGRDAGGTACEIAFTVTDLTDHRRRGRHISYQRGKRNTNPGTSLIQIEGVQDPKAASFYLGKRIAYVYRAKREIRGSKIRVLWGKVTRTHGKATSKH